MRGGRCAPLDPEVARAGTWADAVLGVAVLRNNLLQIYAGEGRTPLAERSFLERLNISASYFGTLVAYQRRQTTAPSRAKDSP